MDAGKHGKQQSLSGMVGIPGRTFLLDFFSSPLTLVSTVIIGHSYGVTTVFDMCNMFLRLEFELVFH